jgi:hypothetical protein
MLHSIRLSRLFSLKDFRFTDDDEERKKDAGVLPHKKPPNRQNHDD